MSAATQQTQITTITTTQHSTSLPPPRIIGQERLYDARQMSTVLGCSSGHINFMVNSGILKQFVPLFSRTCKFPRHYVREADFLAFLETDKTDNQC